MPESTQPASQGHTPASFAALLASFTGAAKRGKDDWDDSALADDVATISYEQALSAHRRTSTPEIATERLLDTSPLTVPGPSGSNSAPLIQKRRKTASITLRITEAEESQLHERAAAARLSLSAYIRSCIFEAESLRTQVKEALAQMQSASPPRSTSVSPAPALHSWQARLLPHWARRGKQPTAAED